MATKVEQAWMDAITQLGCCVCILEGKGPTPAEPHHMLSGEYLRHETALTEAPNEHGFKVNDHWWPDLARLYMLMTGREGFFECRVAPGSMRAA